MNARDYEILKKISDEASIILEMISDTHREAFLGDERTKRAVCMTLINIGELVKMLSDECREANKAIPWRKISGLRDVTAHGYQTLRMEDIWETVTIAIPKLLNNLETIL